MPRRCFGWGRGPIPSQLGHDSIGQVLMSWKRYSWICLALYLGSRALSGQPPPGTLLWSHEVGDAINSSPALAPDGTLYIGTSLAIYAVTNSATTASNKWVLAPSGVNGSITIG